MIYTNLFKTNKTNKAKSQLYYLVESRKYKFSLIFDKKFTSIMSGMALGSFMIVAVNAGIYAVVTFNNSIQIEELSLENGRYESSLVSLDSQKKSYLDNKVNADNIFNISDKPTKWSSIVDNISKQLPYDSVLTSVKTVNEEFIKENDKNPSNEGGSIPENEEDKADDDNVENENENEDGSDTNGDSETNSDEQEEQTSDDKKPENGEKPALVDNNIIAIEGKSLSMVNISLFLDKLDKLDIFSKVECTKAERNAESHYYDFTIYAILN